MGMRNPLKKDALTQLGAMVDHVIEHQRYSDYYLSSIISGTSKSSICLEITVFGLELICA